MALIAIAMDIAEGHLFPSFGLAHSLARKGHRIIYISIPDNERFIRAQGFDFYAVFEDIYPEGSNQELKRIIKQEGYDYTITDGYHFGSFATERFQNFLTTIKPDLFILSCFLNIEALILYYKFGISPVLLTPFLRAPASDISAGCINEIVAMPAERSVKLIELMNELGVNMTSLSVLTNPLDQFHELILCPAELEIGSPVIKKNVHYTGSFVDARQSLGDALPKEVPTGKELIYASMGSQAITYKGDVCNKFFSSILEVMQQEDMGDLHLILAIGKGNTLPDDTIIPGNVSVLPWVSQTDALKKASLAIIHGGLGTVKECIYYGVPMIVIPLVTDQPLNAKRVEHHRLGSSIRLDELTPGSLHGVIRSVRGNDKINASVQYMQQVFHQRDEGDSGPDIIEHLLNLRVV